MDKTTVRDLLDNLNFERLSDLETMARHIGYRSVNEMMEDNPGMMRAMAEWVLEEGYHDDKLDVEIEEDG